MSNPDTRRTPSPVALVLCGGGSRGAMEVGFYRYRIDEKLAAQGFGKDVAKLSCCAG